MSIGKMCSGEMFVLEKKYSSIILGVFVVQWYLCTAASQPGYDE